MVNAFRYGLLGVSDVPLWVAYALMLGFVVALGALGLWLLQARRRAAQLTAGAGGFHPASRSVMATLRPHLAQAGR